MKRIVFFLSIAGVISICFFYSNLKNREEVFNPATFDVVPLKSLSSPLTEEAKQLLAQSFTYLDEGGQAYAFCSSDNKYVLKIFKKKYIKPKWYTALLPNVSWLKQVKEKHRTKLLSSVIKAYVDAFGLDSQGCGIVYIHFNPEERINRVLEVQDRLGKRHHLDLDKTPFLIQERAIPFCEVLKQHLDKGETALAKKRIDQILDLYDRHMDLGFYDLGIGVLHNNGFVGERPIHLDVGRFVFAPERDINKKQKMEEIKGRIQAFVLENCN